MTNALNLKAAVQAYGTMVQGIWHSNSYSYTSSCERDAAMSGKAFQTEDLVNATAVGLSSRIDHHCQYEAPSPTFICRAALQKLL